MNILEVLYSLFYKLLEYSSVAWDFIFETHPIGIQLIKRAGDKGYLIDFTFDFNLFGMLAGGGFLVFLLLWLVKEFIPVA